MEYIYYWYHHMMPTEERKKISKTIQEKDYEGFIELYKEYSILAIKYGYYSEEFETWFPMIFLPDTITYWPEGAEKPEFLSILEKENFMKITYEECECG